jgi:hypothetical protein
LAALDTLFELKDQIPGLITASGKSAADGEWRPMRHQNTEPN